MNDDLFRRQAAPLLIVISGPSGVGKDAVLARMEERGAPFHFVVTAPTRPQRAGEVEGRDYIFVARPDFDHMVETGQMLEHALVYNDYKGIPRQQVAQALASGREVGAGVDVQGGG